jgi:hypothetical protein
MLSHEPFNAITPAPPARLAYNRERWRADVRQRQWAVAGHFIVAACVLAVEKLASSVDLAAPSRQPQLVMITIPFDADAELRAAHANAEAEYVAAVHKAIADRTTAYQKADDEFLAASERAMAERRSAFAKARSIADTYWASFAKAEATFAKVEREATNRSDAIRENEEAVEKPALVG